MAQLAKQHDALASQVAQMAASQQRVESLLGAIAAHVGVASKPVTNL